MARTLNCSSCFPFVLKPSPYKIYHFVNVLLLIVLSFFFLLFLKVLLLRTKDLSFWSCNLKMDDKTREWQMEMVMEKLRSKSPKGKSFFDLAKSHRMALLVRSTSSCCIYTNNYIKLPTIRSKWTGPIQSMKRRIMEKETNNWIHTY